MKALDELGDHPCFEGFAFLGGATAAFGERLAPGEEWQGDDPLEMPTEGEYLFVGGTYFSLQPRELTAPARGEARRGVDDRAQIDALEGRVRKLEAQLAKLQGVGDANAHAEAGEEAAVSPHSRWIESHLDQLRALPDAWVVLDADKGIVFHSTDEATLAAKLEEYAPADSDRLMVFHTSMYV